MGEAVYAGKRIGRGPGLRGTALADLTTLIRVTPIWAKVCRVISPVRPGRAGRKPERPDPCASRAPVPRKG
ncbi:hypothetical protein FraEuI1c_0797 [Pseudofrankia inefficax]|uniref:Uncharacterized protein n=1 Tax=Pseudofrankia inefficax (strain DSM 45817 / CECT 9037 / DDB 130130 / EuI1c) TaxID=298654 RepID=E3IUZ5_PSEI1|nr:hypothetical protein FraEuI1c_0797 [Pseudofrankia inefficax]